MPSLRNMTPVAGWPVKLLGILGLVLLLTVIYAPITIVEIAQESRPSDYTVHIAAAGRLAQGYIPDAYFLFQFLVHAVHQSFGLESLDQAATVVIVGAEVSFGLILFYGLFPQTLGFGIRCATVLGVMLAFDVVAMYLFDGHLYLGQVGINSYHSPTIILLTPIAAAQFLLVARIFNDESARLTVLRICTLAALTVLAGLAKPSYQICLVPATGLMFVFWKGRKTRLELLGSLSLGLWIPAVLLLAWQFSVEFGASGPSIMLAPLLVFLHDSAAWTMLPKLIFGIFFPLAVVAAYGRRIFSDAPLRLAWVTFMVAMGYAYLLAESAPRTFHGNFWWGMETSGVLLLATSARYHLVQAAELALCNRNSLLRQLTTMPRYALPSAAFMLHVLSGIIWYADSVQPRNHW